MGKGRVWKREGYGEAKREWGRVWVRGRVRCREGRCEGAGIINNSGPTILWRVCLVVSLDDGFIFRNLSSTI